MPKFDTLAVPSPQLLGLSFTLAALFSLGGSPREDAESLALLNPIMILCCGAALITAKREHLRIHLGLVGFFAATILLIALYLVPLPASLEYFFSAGTGSDQARAASNILAIQQYLGVSQAAVRQSLFFLFAPMAVLLFGLQLGNAELRRTLPFIIAVGTISGIIGVMQLAGSASGPLYFYRITNHGSAVGLFANRNHNAVFLACLFPMLAVFATSQRTTNQRRSTASRLLAAALAVFLIPLILVTGSRSGMLIAIIGLIGGVLLSVSGTPNVRFTGRKWMVPIVATTAALCLGFATIFFSRAEAIDRLLAHGGVENERVGFWRSSLPLFWDYFPLGFGPGSFVPAFQQVEPPALLGHRYLNRLHNDWLETVLAFGVLGIIFMLGAAGYYMVRSTHLWGRMDGAHSTVAIGRMASIVITILAAASLADYSLRTPAMAGFAALVLVWFAHARAKSISC